MQALILDMNKYPDAALNWDRSRDLLIISYCEAFKHEIHLVIIIIISILIVIYLNKNSIKCNNSFWIWKSNQMRF
jgi:hypothetical protein